MKGLPRIGLPSTRTALFGVSIFVLIILGIGIILSSNNEINAQKAQVALLQQSIQKNNEQISKLVKNNASQSAQIKALLTQPTPTPVVEYQTQYVAQPSSESNPSSIPGVSKAQLSCWMLTGSAKGCPQQ